MLKVVDVDLGTWNNLNQLTARYFTLPGTRPIPKKYSDLILINPRSFIIGKEHHLKKDAPRVAGTDR
jgi:hypothetical protein